LRRPESSPRIAEPEAALTGYRPSVIPYELGFNLLVLALDGAALALTGRSPRLAAPAILLWCLGVFLGVLAFGGQVAFMRAFFAARLASYAIFLHGPLCWIGLAWVLRRQGRAGGSEGGEEGSKPSPWAPRAALALGLLLACVGVDAFLIEPTALQIRRVQVPSARVQEPLRIVVLADLQTDAIGPYEREVLARIAAEEPDLLLLAGDYLQCWSHEDHERETLALQDALRASGIRPRLGAFAVGGDCESRGWEATFAGTRIQPLQGVAHVDSRIRIQGLSLGESFRGAPALPPTQQLRIVLGHRPDFALAPAEADLLLAGHTHGGQVQLPLIGPLVTLSGVERSWAAGEPTLLPSGATLIVSRGVGMERATAPRLRFLCRPELLVVEVVPSAP